LRTRIAVFRADGGLKFCAGEIHAREQERIIWAPPWSYFIDALARLSTTSDAGYDSIG
jgi:hypothetical protein